MDEALRRRICRLVAGIIVSDDDLDPSEDRFIDRLLASFDIPAGERDLIFPIVDATEASAAMGELPPEAREEALRLLLDAACADGKVVDEERSYLRNVARTIGIDDAETDRMIAVRLSMT